MRYSFVLGNSLFADRSGVAASRFLSAAAACLILLCFSAESCESHCNGGLRLANAALPANLFRFWHYSFSF